MPTLNVKKNTIKKPSYSVYNTTKKERMKYYGTKRWWRLRHQILSEEPLCAKCLKEGLITPAEDLHHIISPFSVPDGPERAELFYNSDNIEPLCKHHHGKFHSQFGRLNKDGTTLK